MRHSEVQLAWVWYKPVLCFLTFWLGSLLLIIRCLPLLLLVLVVLFLILILFLLLLLLLLLLFLILPYRPHTHRRLIPSVDTQSPKGEPPESPIGRRGLRSLRQARHSLPRARRMVEGMHGGARALDEMRGSAPTLSAQRTDTDSDGAVSTRRRTGIVDSKELLKLMCVAQMAGGQPCITKREEPPDTPDKGCMAFTINLVSMFYPVPGLFYSLLLTTHNLLHTTHYLLVSTDC